MCIFSHKNVILKGQQISLDHFGYVEDPNNDRIWKSLRILVGMLGCRLCANPELWPLLDHHDFLTVGEGRLSDFSPQYTGIAWILFAFTGRNAGNADAPLRSDGFVLFCQWRHREDIEGVPGHDPRLPLVLTTLADKIRSQFMRNRAMRKKHPEDYWLWLYNRHFGPAYDNHGNIARTPLLSGLDTLSLSTESDSTVNDTVQDSTRRVVPSAHQSTVVDSAWGALASGLYLAITKQQQPAEWPFSSISYDFEKGSVAGVGLLERKLSAALDFTPTHFWVSPEQGRKGGEAYQAKENLKKHLNERLRNLQAKHDACDENNALREFLEKRMEIVHGRLKTLQAIEIVSPRQTRDPVKVAKEIALETNDFLRILFIAAACLIFLLGVFGWHQFGYQTEYFQDYMDRGGGPVGLRKLDGIPSYLKLCESLQYFIYQKTGRKLPMFPVFSPNETCYRFTCKGLKGLFGDPIVHEVVRIEGKGDVMEYSGVDYVPYCIYYSNYRDENGTPVGQGEISGDQLANIKNCYRFTFKGRTAEGKTKISEISHIEEGDSTVEYLNNEYTSFNIFYDDYITKNSIPQGITRLTPEQTKNMFRHYVFTYKGCTNTGEKILRSVSICNSLGYLAKLPDEIPIVYPLKRHSKCTFHYSDDQYLDKIKRYDSYGKHIDTLIFSIEDQDIVITIKEADDSRLKKVCEYFPTIEFFNSKSIDYQKKVKKMNIKRDSLGRLSSCRYYQSDGKTLAIGKYGENGYQLVYDNDKIKEIILLIDFKNIISLSSEIDEYISFRQYGWRNYYNQNGRIETQESIRLNIKNNEKEVISSYSFEDYDQWGNCQRFFYHNDSGNVSIDKSGVASAKINYDSGMLKCITYFDANKDPTTKKIEYIDYVESEEILNYSQIINIDGSIDHEPFEILDNIYRDEAFFLTRSTYESKSHHASLIFDSQEIIDIEKLQGIHKKKYEYDDIGRINKICYYDKTNLTVPFFIEKIVRIYWEDISFHLKNGKIWPIEKMVVAFYQKDNKPIAIPDFGHKREYNFDHVGNIKKVLMFDLENINNPSTVEFLEDYDKNNNISKKQKLINEGETGIYETWEYNNLEDGKIEVRHSYQTRENKPQIIKMKGIGYEQITYNEYYKPISMKAYNIKNEPCFTDKNYHEIRFHYDNAGFIKEISFYGLDNKQKILCKGDKLAGEKSFHCLRLTNDANGHVLDESYYDTNNNLLFQDTLGYAKKTYYYDLEGRCIEEHYFDENGFSCIKDIKDIFMGRYTGRRIESNPDDPDGEKWIFWKLDGNKEILLYNGKGNCTSKELVQENGHLVNDENGVPVYIYDYAYDEKNHRKIVSVRYYDKDKKTPIFDKQETAGNNVEFNEKMQIEKVTYIGLDGSTKSDKRNIASIKFEYDIYGFQSKQYYFDEKMNRTMSTEIIDRTMSTERIGGWISEYDRQGHQLKKCFIDDKDRLISNGIAIIKYQYDDKSGRLIRERYYNAKEESTVDNDGISGRKYIYKNNKNGYEIEECKIDQNDNLTLGKSNWAIHHSKFNNKGLKISDKYLNENRELITTIEKNNNYKTDFLILSSKDMNGFFDPNIKYIALKFNDFNTITEEHLLSEEYKCIECIYGWAIKQYEYNQNNELEKVSFWDKDKKNLVNSKEVGYSYVTRDITRKDGKIIEIIKFYNNEKNAVTWTDHKFKFFCIKYIYDNLGQLTNIEFFDPFGKPISIHNETLISKISISYDSNGLCRNISYYDDHNNLTMCNYNNISFSCVKIDYKQDNNYEISLFDKDMNYIKNQFNNLKDNEYRAFNDIIFDKYLIIGKNKTVFNPNIILN